LVSSKVEATVGNKISGKKQMTEELKEEDRRELLFLQGQMRRLGIVKRGQRSFRLE
jgi:hypothetical protein